MQDNADPNMLMSRSAFNDVILANGAPRIEEGELQQLEPEAGHVVLEFRCW